MYPVIMAGGTGTRFWPESREKRPKQFLSIGSDHSMLRETFDRLKSLKNSSANKIYVVANDKWKKQIFQHLPELPEKNFISEPSGKNTAPCIGLAATVIKEQNPDAVMGIFPSDHIIGDLSRFRTDVEVGTEIAQEKEALLTFGIQPTRPATGYGYIKYNQDLELKNKVYKVEDFTEKPDSKTAHDFLDNGNYLWNSGMFIWKADTILESIKNHMPELGHSLTKIQSALGSSAYKKTLQKEWKNIDSQSIDYGIMEKADSVYVIQSDFKWSDVGSWDSLYELKDKDQNNNVILGENIEAMETKNCLIKSDSNLISTIGVENLIIVQEEDATIVAKRGEAQKVKKIVKKLRSEGKEEYL